MSKANLKKKQPFVRGTRFPSPSSWAAWLVFFLGGGGGGQPSNNLDDHFSLGFVEGHFYGWCHGMKITILNHHLGEYSSGQIIATSHDLTPKGSWGREIREIPLFQGNLGWWNIIIWPDSWNIFLSHHSQSQNPSKISKCFFRIHGRIFSVGGMLRNQSSFFKKCPASRSADSLKFSLSLVGFF